jgi:CRP-like cAMP-binding protein
VDIVRGNPRNGLLAALPHDVLSSVQPHLKPVSLPRASVVCDVDEPLRRIYFVEAGFISLVSAFEDGTIAEMATVGREGMVGIGTLLGGEHALGRYVVLVPGFALAIETCRFQRALRDSPELRAACEAYAHAFVGHLLRRAACDATHTVEQRCACWLLMWDDQADDTVELTQEYLAEILGVRRSTVTDVADTLQHAGLIQYRRGAIKVLDRSVWRRPRVSATGSSVTVTSDRGCPRKADAGYDGRVAPPVNGSGDPHTITGRTVLRGWSNGA